VQVEQCSTHYESQKVLKMYMYATCLRTLDVILRCLVYACASLCNNGLCDFEVCAVCVVLSVNKRKCLRIYLEMLAGN